jgi:hypothetical protein
MQSVSDCLTAERRTCACARVASEVVDGSHERNSASARVRVLRGLHHQEGSGQGVFQQGRVVYTC